MPVELPSHHEHSDPPDDEAYARYVAELSERLRHVCDNLSEAEFAALVDDIARMRLRFEVLEDLPGALRPLRHPGESTTANRVDRESE